MNKRIAEEIDADLDRLLDTPLPDYPEVWATTARQHLIRLRDERLAAIRRTPEEIEAKVDWLAYDEYCKAQSGSDNYSGTFQLAMLEWLTGTKYPNQYERGERLYQAGVRYEWTGKEYARVDLFV